VNTKGQSGKVLRYIIIIQAPADISRIYQELYPQLLVLVDGLCIGYVWGSSTHLTLTVTLDGYRPLERDQPLMLQRSFESQVTAPDAAASAHVYQTIQAWSEAKGGLNGSQWLDIDVNLCQNS